MTRAYIIQEFPPHEPGWYDNTILDIKKENPDAIYVLSLGEINVEYIFEYFFKDITPWLLENNKYVYVIWAGPDKEIYPHILGVNSLGSAYGNISVVRSIRDNVNLLETSDKLYTSYNNNPKYERKVLVDYLAKYDMLKDGIVSYRYPNGQTQPRYRWKYHDGSILSDEPDFQFGDKRFSMGGLPASYYRGFIDIVCETDSRNGFYIPTEKNAKPWGAMKPYLVVSSKDYHKWLYSEYGIEMYDEMFDYSFDDEELLTDRIIGIVQNLLKLRVKFTKNPDLKRELYEKIKPKLKHNREMALRVFETLRAKNKLIPECLKFITKEDNYELLGERLNHHGGLHFLTDRNWHLNPRLG